MLADIDQQLSTTLSIEVRRRLLQTLEFHENERF
jgi:hypothetical protein